MILSILPLFQWTLRYVPKFIFVIARLEILNFKRTLDTILLQPKIFADFKIFSSLLMCDIAQVLFIETNIYSV